MRGDMTKGREWKHILLFSLPIMAGSFLQQLYSTIDGIVVGNYISSSPYIRDCAVAAVGNGGVLAMVFLSAAMGLGAGAGIMVAQYFGAKREEDMHSACTTSLILLTAVGAVLSMIAVVFIRPISATLLGIDDPDILDMTVSFLRVYCLGLTFQFAYNCVASILRGVGDSKATLYFLLISTVLNMILDLVFVIVFHWGVAGAALGTVISQVTCAAVSLIYMFKKYPIFQFRRGESPFVMEKCVVGLKLGLPATLQQLIISVGNVFLQRLINSFGEITISAVTVGLRVQNYATVPPGGLNIAISTFTGQNLGAGKPERVRRGWRYTAVMNVGICIALSFVTYTLAPQLSSLFGISADAQAQSVEYIRFMAMTAFTLAFYWSFSGVLQGAGDILFATLASLTSLGIRVAVAYAMAYWWGVGYASTWYSIPIGWAFGMILVAIRYFRGHWRDKAIVELPGRKTMLEKELLEAEQAEMIQEESEEIL